MNPLTITVFSDFTCPYSYVTEAALRALVDTAGIRLVHHPFELFPAPAPLPPPGAPGDWENATRALSHDIGIGFAEPTFRPRTRKAHEAAFFALASGVGDQMRSAIYEAYWKDGEDIGRVDVLMGLIASLGTNPEDLKIALDIDSYSDQVSASRTLADRLNITSTPTIFIGTGPGAAIIVGARTAEDLEHSINAQRNQHG